LEFPALGLELCLLGLGLAAFGVVRDEPDHGLPPAEGDQGGGDVHVEDGPILAQAGAIEAAGQLPVGPGVEENGAEGTVRGRANVVDAELEEFGLRIAQQVADGWIGTQELGGTKVRHENAYGGALKEPVEVVMAGHWSTSLCALAASVMALVANGMPFLVTADSRGLTPRRPQRRRVGTEVAVTSM
jgi:hypothetical protein